MKAKKVIKIIVILAVLAGAAYGIKYSIDAYKKGQADLGIVICDDEKCQKSMHVHSDIEFELCGSTEFIQLPREEGELSGLHTHKETNYLHFHDSIPLDHTTREDMYDKRLTIQEVLDTFAETLEVSKYCDMSRDPQVSVLVNDLAPSEGLQYNWKDGDVIKIIYSY